MSASAGYDVMAPNVFVAAPVCVAIFGDASRLLTRPLNMATGDRAPNEQMLVRISVQLLHDIDTVNLPSPTPPDKSNIIPYGHVPYDDIALMAKRTSASLQLIAS